MDGFHWQDGWYFKRLPGGDVSVVKLDAAGSNVLLASAVIPAAEWASIVASVSHAGSTAESYEAAKDLHEGRV